MAYRAKYRYTIQANGVTHQLVIAKKDYSGSETSLNGLLQSIRIQRLGDNLIESPIVKSALTFTLVDRDGGMWEEFFTPDATEYRVTFLTDSDERWTGYITPDSYEEDLVYRGSISITARDMVGHMADIPFDKSHIDPFYIKGDTLVSVYDLIDAGMKQAGVAMYYDFRAENERIYMRDVESNHTVDGWLVDIRGLEGKNWYQIVEGLLDSLGLVMRWEDNNKIVVTSIEDVSMGGNTGADMNPEYPIQFWNGSGHRSLEPSFRMIDETLTYDILEEDLSKWNDEAFTGTQLNGKNGWYAGDATKQVVAPFVTDTYPRIYTEVGEDDREKYVFLACTPESLPAKSNFMYRSWDSIPLTKFKLSFELSHFCILSSGTCFVQENGRIPNGVLEYSIRWHSNNKVYYLKEDGTWDPNGGFNLTLEPSTGSGTNPRNVSADSTIRFEKSFTTPEEEGFLRVVIHAFHHRLKVLGSGAVDTESYWIRMGEITLALEKNQVPKNLKVKTNYDARQNYTLTRKPMFGKTPARVTSSGVILNGFYANRTGYPSIQRAKMGSGTALPLPVVVDMEILVRHTSTTSLITGTIADKEGRPLFMNGIWWYGNHLMILQAGSLDPIRNCIEGAILREFLTGRNWIVTDYEIK